MSETEGRYITFITQDDAAKLEQRLAKIESAKRELMLDSIADSERMDAFEQRLTMLETNTRHVQHETDDLTVRMDDAEGFLGEHLNSKELVDALAKSASGAHRMAGEAMGLADGLKDRIVDLENATAYSVTLTTEQDIVELELEETARNMAGLFLTLVESGATPQQASLMATAWLKAQGSE